ncbi:DNA -binding domain-containing protein [Martelella sp. AMO21009]
MANPDYLDEPPVDDRITDYDRTHFKTYLRLLDADAEGADWKEAVEIIFGIDPMQEPDRALHIHTSHLARARWMTEHGYRHLLSGNPR